MNRSRLPINHAAQILATVIAIEITVRQALPSDPTARMAATGLLRIGEAVLMLWWVSRLKEGLLAIGIHKEKWGQGIKAGGIWSAAFAASAVVAGIVIRYGFGADPVSLIKVNVPKELLGTLLLIGVAGIVSPVAEEVFFRGVLYAALRRHGAVTAIIGSTAAFIAVHAGQPGFPLIQGIGGLVFALSRERTNGLAAPLVIHILGNLAVYALSVF